MLFMFETAGDVLRRARLLSGLAQRELADRSGVSQPVISVYEKGRREPGLKMLNKLVDATGYELVIELVPRGSRTQMVPVEQSLLRRVRQQREAILAIAARRGAHNVRLFGSVARGDESETSDVDLLVDLADGVSLLELIGLERELSELLGCEVDVVPERNVKAGIAERVMLEATPV